MKPASEACLSCGDWFHDFKSGKDKEYSGRIRKSIPVRFLPSAN